MKKSLSSVLILLLVALLCACGASKNMAAEDADINLEMQSYSLERSSGAEESMTEDDFGEAATNNYDVSDARTVPAEQLEQLVYVTFLLHSDYTLDNNSGKVFTYQCYEPTILTEDDAVNDWIASVVDNASQATAKEIGRVEQQALYDLENREDVDASFYTYSYYSNVTTERMDNHVLSALQVNSIYSGGAHPNYAQIAYNLDLSNQTVLSLSDVILPNTEDELKQRVLDELSGRFGGLENSGLYPDYAEIVSSSFEPSKLTSNWYFTENSLVIYFNCYDIAPYAAGIIKISLPYETLGEILDPAFLPDRSIAGEGSVAHITSLDGRQVLDAGADGDRFYIGTDKMLNDVKLYRITGWITEDVPIMGQMMFAANRLSSKDALTLQNYGGFDYLLTCRNREGQLLKVAVSATELKEIVAEVAE